MKTTTFLTVLLLISISVNAQVVKVSSFSQNFSPPAGTNGPVYKVNYNVDVSIIDGMVGSGLRVSLSPKSIAISSYRYEGKEYTSSQIKSPLFSPSSAMGGYSFRIAVSHKGITVGDGRLSGAGMLTGGSYNISLEKLGYKMPGRDEDPVEAGKKTAAISKALKESVYGIQSSEPQYASLIASTNASFEKEIKKYLDSQKPKEEPKERVDATIELSVGSGSSSSSDRRDDNNNDREDASRNNPSSDSQISNDAYALSIRQGIAEGRIDPNRDHRPQITPQKKNETQFERNKQAAVASSNAKVAQSQAQLASRIQDLGNALAIAFPTESAEKTEEKSKLASEAGRKDNSNLKLLQKRAIQGDIDACKSLADEYKSGKNEYVKGEHFGGNVQLRNPNFAEAVKWYMKHVNLTMEKGESAPLYSLAQIAVLFHTGGYGLTRDMGKYQEFTDLVFELDNDGRGCNHLGFNLSHMYRPFFTGGHIGHRKQFSYLNQYSKEGMAEVVKCYRKAEEKGHKHSMRELGILYKNGWGVKKDKKEAERLFKKSEL